MRGESVTTSTAAWVLNSRFPASKLKVSRVRSPDAQRPGVDYRLWDLKPRHTKGDPHHRSANLFPIKPTHGGLGPNWYVFLLTKNIEKTYPQQVNSPLSPLESGMKKKTIVLFTHKKQWKKKIATASDSPTPTHGERGEEERQRSGGLAALL